MTVIALLLQANAPWGVKNPNCAMFPMALLTAIVRKEALLPEHTAAFAATQLLPVVHAATDRHAMATIMETTSLHLLREFQVSASVTPAGALQAPTKAATCSKQMACWVLPAQCLYAGAWQ